MNERNLVIGGIYKHFSGSGQEVRKMKNQTELKSCPFCGGKALLSHDRVGIEASYVRCEKCGLESIRFIKSFECASDDRAVEFWNRRDGDEDEKSD